MDRVETPNIEYFKEDLSKTDKIEVGDPSSPSSVFEKEAAKSIILKEMGTNRDLNKVLGFTLGYDDYMKSKKDEPWKWGFE